MIILTLKAESLANHEIGQRVGSNESTVQFAVWCQGGGLLGRGTRGSMDRNGVQYFIILISARQVFF